MNDGLEEFYGFRRPPFGPVIDESRVFHPPSRRLLVDRLVADVLDGRDVISARGQRGIGKTSLMIGLAAALRAQGAAVLSFAGELASPFGVERRMAAAGGPAAEMLLPGQLHRNLQSPAHARRLVLLFDDADTLSEPMFRFLHDVLDLSYRTATSLSLVLLGQLGQWPGLGDPDLGALRQATMSRHFIPALAPEESRAYLDHRLAEAGRPPHRIMTRAAVLALVDRAGGVPGQIDALAQLALVHGYRWRRRRITARLVRRALSDPAGLRAPAMPRPRFLLAAGIGAGALALAALGVVLGWQAERAPVSRARLPVIVARGPGPTDRAAARAPQAPPLPAPTPRPAQPRLQAPAGQPPSADGGPGLVLVARPGDSLEKLYTSVYRGMNPPPFQAVLALNQGPLRPGTLLIFPAPPGGWASYRRARSPSG